VTDFAYGLHQTCQRKLVGDIVRRGRVVVSSATICWVSVGTLVVMIRPR
jgi:hypothetical protein